MVANKEAPVYLGQSPMKFPLVFLKYSLLPVPFNNTVDLIENERKPCSPFAIWPFVPFTVCAMDVVWLLLTTSVVSERTRELMGLYTLQVCVLFIRYVVFGEVKRHNPIVVKLSIQCQLLLLHLWLHLHNLQCGVVMVTILYRLQLFGQVLLWRSCGQLVVRDAASELWINPSYFLNYNYMWQKNLEV